MALSDAELAAAAGAGDGAAFAELYDRHGESVYSFCLRVLGSSHDAADATQETFLRVLERLRAEGAEPVSNVRAYLLTSARHASWRVLERRKRVVSGEKAPEVASAAAGAEALVLTRDLQDEVRDANAGLPVRQREVLALREVEGLSYEEIGQIMDVRPNAAAQLAWRARASFKSAVRKGSLRGIAPRGPECELALTLLELREDAPLDEESEAWLEQHLDECERCSASRAFMLEAGATYRVWAPALGAVAAVKVGLLDRAGTLVGADWSAHGAAAGAGGGGGSGAAGARPRGTRVPPAVVGALLVVAAAAAIAAAAGGLPFGGGGGGGGAGAGGGAGSGSASAGGGGAGASRVVAAVGSPALAAAVTKLIGAPAVLSSGPPSPGAIAAGGGGAGAGGSRPASGGKRGKGGGGLSGLVGAAAGLGAGTTAATPTGPLTPIASAPPRPQPAPVDRTPRPSTPPRKRPPGPTLKPKPKPASPVPLPPSSSDSTSPPPPAATSPPAATPPAPSAEPSPPAPTPADQPSPSPPSNPQPPPSPAPSPPVCSRPVPQGHGCPPGHGGTPPGRGGVPPGLGGRTSPAP